MAFVDALGADNASCFPVLRLDWAFSSGSFPLVMLAGVVEDITGDTFWTP